MLQFFQIIYLKKINMVPIKKPLEVPDGLKAGIRDVVIEELLNDEVEHNIKDFYRSASICDLQDLYNDKCAACERDRGTELQVDHYRPKKSRNNTKDPQYNQPGYLWLVYEWTNLVPLCSKCNQKKSNKFPLKGWNSVNRVVTRNLPSGEVNKDAFNSTWLNEREKPLIINPEIEKHPAKHFKFLNNGIVKGRTVEGKETINVYDMNRGDLKRERLQRIKEIVTAIQSAFDDYSKDLNNAELKGELKGTFKSMRIRCSEDLQFSLFNFFIYNYFEYYISSQLPDQVRPVVNKYFLDFKNK